LSLAWQPGLRLTDWVNFKTGTYYFHRSREIIGHNLEQEADAIFSGETEADESYFCGKHKKKRGRGAAKKVSVFGLLKRRDKVCTKVILDASSATLYPIIERKSCLIVSCIQIAEEAITCWMHQSLCTSVSTIPNYLQTRPITSMALRTFRTKPSFICVNLTVLPSNILGYF
jgi:hypothetical protein